MGLVSKVANCLTTFAEQTMKVLLKWLRIRSTGFLGSQIIDQKSTEYSMHVWNNREKIILFIDYFLISFHIKIQSIRVVYFIQCLFKM